MTIYTTLNEIREHSPCSDGWSNLLESLDKTHADDEPLALEQILDSNGLDDALWALRVVRGHDKDLRLFACQCARLVLPIFEERYPGDARPRKAIEAAEAFALGQIGKAELEKAYANAADASRAAYAAYACAAAYADACAAAETTAAYAAYADAYAADADTCAAAYTDAAATYAYAYADACADACAAAEAAAAYAYFAADATTRLEIEKLFLGM